MDYKEFSELILTRQATREFNDKPLEKQTVLEIAKSAVLAPSACNSQPWKLYCVTDADKVKEVTKAVQGKVQNRFLDNAKAYICFADQIATLKPEAMVRFNRNHFVQYDVGEAVAYATLSAESMGVKSCIIGWVDQTAIKTALGLTENEVCNVVVALGYSDTPLRKKIRKDKESVIVEL